MTWIPHRSRGTRVGDDIAAEAASKVERRWVENYILVGVWVGSRSRLIVFQEGEWKLWMESIRK